MTGPARNLETRRARQAHRLTDRERGVLDALYGLSDGTIGKERQRQYGDVASEWNVSMERIRQIEHNARRQLLRHSFVEDRARYAALLPY